MNSPRRRALLGAVGLAAVGSSAGCLQTNSSDSEADATTTDSTEQAETESTGRTETESTATTRRTERTDDLFLKNRRADDQLLDLHVLRRQASTAGERDEESREGEESKKGEEASEDADGGESGDKRLVAQRYEVTAGSTLELPNLGVVGNTYTVEVRLPGEEWQKFAWAVLDCAEYGTPTSEPRTPEDDPTLDTDAMVELRDDGIEFLRNECDAIAFSRDSAPPASEHVVRDSRTTTET